MKVPMGLKTPLAVVQGGMRVMGASKCARPFGDLAPAM